MAKLFDAVVEEALGGAAEAAAPGPVARGVTAETTYEITRGVGGPAVGYLIAATAIGHVGPFSRSVTFTDGTAWLVGTGLDPAVPADGFVGAAFSTATLEIPTGRGPLDPAPRPAPAAAPGTPPEPAAAAGPAGAPAPGTIAVPAATTARFTVEPAAAAAPAGAVDDDGARATVQLPPTATFDLAPAGIQLTGLADSELTVYGVTVQLHGGPAAAAYDPTTWTWEARFAEVTGALHVAGARSTVFPLAGTAPVTQGGWRLPVVRTTPATLAHAAGSALGLEVGPGLHTRQGHPARPVELAGADLTVRDGWLRVTATTGPRPFTDTVTLWNAVAAMAASLVVHAPAGSTVTSTQSAAADLVGVAGCGLEAHLDRPCLADGSMPDMRRLVADYGHRRTAAGTTVTIVAEGAAGPYSVESYVLENALLRTDGVTELVLVGTLTGSRATSGRLAIGADLVRLVPTLPDPYAADLSDTGRTTGTLVAEVIWTAPDDPVVAFEILGRATAAARSIRDDGRDTLYDVSGAEDQLGVVLLEGALATAQVSGQVLQVPGAASALFALPQVAWEAVVTDGGAGRALFPAFAADDGPAAVVNVTSQELRPMTPDGFLGQFLTDFAAGADLTARFTLPFGLEAVVDTAHTDPPSPAARPTLSLASPTFPSGTGGRQLAIASADGRLPGRSYPSTDTADAGYPATVLDPAIASFWDQEFDQGVPDDRPFVPVERIDLSGYGASTFSDYLDPDIGTGVSEARFDVIVGRTSYALVQIQSFLCPYQVRVVNTTIFERDGAGWVQRRNTGWRAKSPGAFDLGPGLPVEHGGVTQVVDVRNIATVAGPPLDAGGKQWAEVRFDADVDLVTGPHGLTLTGGDTGGGRIAGTAFSGWIDMTVGAPPTLDEVVALLDAVRAAGGPVAGGRVTAAVDIAGVGIAMTLTGIDVAPTSPAAAARTLGVAVRGLPTLPRDGSWSVAKRAASQPTPSPVDPLTPVPLVRNSADETTWHLAEPADVLHLATPDTLYALVQSTGTQQLYLENPTVTDQPAGNPLQFATPPKLADVGALLGGGGLLPDLSALLDFPAFTGLVPVGDGLGTTQQLTTTTVLPDVTLIPLGPISIVLATNADPDPALQPLPPAPPGQSVLTVVLDPTATPRWSVTITNVAFKLLVDGMSSSADPLVAVIGDIVAADGQRPTLKNLAFAYGTSLSFVKDVLSGIQDLAAALPGGADSGLDVAFSGTKLSVRDAVALPQLPLGLGYLEGISLDLGFELDVLAGTSTFRVGVGTDENPFSWLCSPLAGNGLLQLGAGQTLGIRMQGGIGVGLGIDLAIASGSASVCLAVQLDTTKTPFGVMVLLTGNAAVDVLDGLASAALTLTAGLGLQVSPGPPGDLLEIPPDLVDYISKTSITLSAEVAVAIHLTVGWLLHVDWSGSWGFSETVSGSALTSILP